MSLSISGVHTAVPQGTSADPSASHASHPHSASSKASVSSSSSPQAPAIPTLTLAEEAAKLANSGLSKEQIATTLGLTVTQVLASLHETTPTTQSSAADLEALSARLSVKA